MGPTPNMMGLLMTHNKSVFNFHCENQDTCYWMTEDYALQVSRNAHIMISLPIPEAILRGCKYPDSICKQCGDGFWNLTENGCQSEFQLFVHIYAK